MCPKLQQPQTIFFFKFKARVGCRDAIRYMGALKDRHQWSTAILEKVQYL